MDLEDCSGSVETFVKHRRHGLQAARERGWTFWKEREKRDDAEEWVTGCQRQPTSQPHLPQ